MLLLVKYSRRKNHIEDKRDDVGMIIKVEKHWIVYIIQGNKSRDNVWKRFMPRATETMTAISIEMVKT